MRLREGEANILSGILNQQEQVNWSGIPGLSSIPILKYLFGSKDHPKTDDEMVFLMVPHIVRSQDLTPLNLRTIDTGVGQAIELRHIATAGGGRTHLRPVPRRDAGRCRSRRLGPGPGADAQAAGLRQPLAQLSSAANANGRPGGSRSRDRPLAPAPEAKVFRWFLRLDRSQRGYDIQVPVVITGARISSVPFEIQYDPSKLSLVNVGGRLPEPRRTDGRAHASDDDPGEHQDQYLASAGSPGINGAGVVCVLSFQAKAAGETTD